MQTALVLAGGGVAGIAWELGVLRGLADHSSVLGASVLSADLVVGTSAGAAVGAQITSEVPLADLYDAQFSPTSAEIEVAFDPLELTSAMTRAARESSSGREMRQRVGALALAAATVDEPTRLAAISARLPVPSWPARDLRLTAIEVVSGELTVFTTSSGVPLVAAVAASCAVPGVWPPVTIDGLRYMDGGVRSGTNADLATGAERVLIISPTLPDAPLVADRVAVEIERIRPAASHVVWADAQSIAAFGANPLSPANRAPSATAGRAVGQRVGAEVAAFWS